MALIAVLVGPSHVGCAALNRSFRPVGIDVADLRKTEQAVHPVEDPDEFAGEASREGLPSRPAWASARARAWNRL